MDPDTIIPYRIQITFFDKDADEMRSRWITTEADQDSARKVLAFVGLWGSKDWNGDFYKALIEAFFRADEEHFARLAAGFPQLATAVTIYKTRDWGLHTLEQLANAE